MLPTSRLKSKSTPTALRMLLTGLALAASMTFAPASHAATSASATKGGPFGFGIILGDPSALTGKYMLNPNTGIDGGVSFDFGRWFMVYGDWLYHARGAFGSPNDFAAHLTPYLGLGGLIALANRDDFQNDRYFSNTSSSKFALGLRIPLGLEWRPATVPVGVFLELVPGLTIAPATNSFLQGGIGARFFF